MRFSPSNDDEASEKAGALARQSRASQSKPFAPFDAALSPFSWQSATVRGRKSFLSNGRRERCFRIREKKPRREAPNMTRSTEETHPVLFLATRARLVAVSLALFQKKLNLKPFSPPPPPLSKNRSARSASRSPWARRCSRCASPRRSSRREQRRSRRRRARPRAAPPRLRQRRRRRRPSCRQTCATH